MATEAEATREAKAKVVLLFNIFMHAIITLINQEKNYEFLGYSSRR
jgi:hypothetical protein